METGCLVDKCMLGVIAVSLSVLNVQLFQKMLSGRTTNRELKNHDEVHDDDVC